MKSRVLRFLVSGGSAATVEYLAFFLLQRTLGIKWLVFGQSLSFVCGFATSFLLNRKWVFKSSDGAGKELTKYTTLAVINLVVGNIAIIALTGPVEVNQYVAKSIVMIFIAAWNYIIMSTLVFRNR